MKLSLLSLLFAAAHGIGIRSLDRDPTKASADELLGEIKRRLTDCGAGEGPLAPASTDELFAELKKREAAKKCEAAAPPPAAPASPKQTTETETETTPTTTTTTGPDNFADELLDQANVDFDMLDKDKDGCISEPEMTKALKRQVEVARTRDYYWQQKNVTDSKGAITNGIEKEHSAADANDDGCLSKEEFLKVKHATDDCPRQFTLMDLNADKQISRQEAATYVSEHMGHADISHDKFLAIWQAADVDKNNFLSFDEFCEAGPRYKGDGNNEKKF